LPYEDLFVEGTKVVMINQEEYSPVRLRRDPTHRIDGDNSCVLALATPRVEITGRGDIADTVDARLA
jgi:hypothetical protein